MTTTTDTGTGDASTGAASTTTASTGSSATGGEPPVTTGSPSTSGDAPTGAAPDLPDSTGVSDPTPGASPGTETAGQADGGCGCSTGHAPADMSLVTLAAFVLRRRRRRVSCSGAGTTAGGTSMPTAAHGRTTESAVTIAAPASGVGWK